MKIAIAERKGSYSDYWINYCKKNRIDYKAVCPYDTDIIQQVQDCDIFLWHYHQSNSKDILFAKQLLFSLEMSGKVVFPDFKTGWHFDDKLGQKYLFESLGINAAPAYAFFDKKDAYAWAERTSYPKVFKLRRGAGSSNVMLAKNVKQAKRYINKVFTSGYKQFRYWDYINDRYRQYKSGTLSAYKLVRSFGVFLLRNRYSKIAGKEIGYAYFQNFIQNDGFDYRVEIVGNKAIAMVRYCRKNDFRASGGHNDHFEKDLIPEDVIKTAFEIVEKLGMTACALDLVRDNKTKKLFLVEVSYCYGVDPDEFEHGFWTKDAIFHNEEFCGIDWIIEECMNQLVER